MALISDNSQVNKLKKYNINIKTKYIVDNKILERNTDNSINDEINKGIRCEKNYYVNNKLIHTEKIFDSRIEYTYITNKQEEKEYKCPNCGMQSKLKDFLDGCPYCGTHYNVDYVDKNLGSKYHYDLVLRNNIYRIVTYIVDIIVSIILAFIFIKTTSRTFNSYDKAKIFIYGFILSLILYYIFYIMDAYVILGPIKRYKDKQNKKQIDFWNRTKIDKKTFFNNLKYEISNKYYKEDNIIDYDVIDYDEFTEFSKDDFLYVKVKAYVRIAYYENNSIKTKYVDQIYVLKKITDDVLELKEGANIIKCHNCGASIDASKGKCEYCGSKIKYYQAWILVE